MSSSVALPKQQAAINVRLAWSQMTPGCPRGLAIAREKGTILAWDTKHWLTLLNRAGQRQAQVPAPKPLSLACVADDGSAYVACGQAGEVWWLAPDLKPRWERTIRHKVLAAALDPFGHYLALADDTSHLHIFDRAGRPLNKVQTARPLHHVAFVPEVPLLVGAADFGLLTCFDLTGNNRWQLGLVVHCGALAVAGNGTTLLLACFNEGVRSYDARGKFRSRLAGNEPCRLLSMSYDGRRLLTVDLAQQAMLRDGEGTALASVSSECPVVSLALSPLADRAYLALENGQLTAFDLNS